MMTTQILHNSVLLGVACEDAAPAPAHAHAHAPASLPKPYTGRGADGSGAILPAPIPFASDIGAEIAILGVKAGRDEQQVNQRAEQMENDLQDTAEQSEVGQMRKEAGDILTFGMLGAACQVVQGATLIGGASGSQSVQMAAQGSASIWGAGATLFTAVGQAQQQTDQAMVTAYKAVADSAGQSASTDRQAESDAQSVVKNAIQFYQQYVETKAQTDLTAAGQKA